MWLLVLKNADKGEVLNHFTMACEYKQVGDDVHCQYYTKKDLKDDLSSAERSSGKKFESEIQNLGKHKGIWFY